MGKEKEHVGRILNWWRVSTESLLKVAADRYASSYCSQDIENAAQAVLVLGRAAIRYYEAKCATASEVRELEIEEFKRLHFDHGLCGMPGCAKKALPYFSKPWPKDRPVRFYGTLVSEAEKPPIRCNFHRRFVGLLAPKQSRLFDKLWKICFLTCVLTLVAECIYLYVVLYRLTTTSASRKIFLPLRTFGTRQDHAIVET